MADERTELDFLVRRFSAALFAKLLAAEEKHGWKGAWHKDDWGDQVAAELLRHVGKGDPLDVAAYCAFAWHHGWPTNGGHGAGDAIEILAIINALRAGEGDSVTILCDNPDFNDQPDRAILCNGDWTGWQDWRFAADTLVDCLRAAQTALFAHRQAAAE